MFHCKGGPFGNLVAVSCVISSVQRERERESEGGEDQSGVAVGGSISICHRDGSHKNMLEITC